MRPLVVALLWVQAAPEEVGPARPVSFAQARGAAERLAAEVLVAERRVEMSRADIAVAGALANPTVTVLTSRLTPLLSSELSVPLPLFGQRQVAVRAARADLEVSLLELEVTRNLVRWNATLAWIELWEVQERARVLALAAQEAQRLLEIAQERFAAGSAPRLDVVRATANRARAAAEAGAARATIAAAAARLGPWLGEAGDRPVQAAGEPGYPAVPPGLGALATEAAQHPELARDRAETRAAEAHVHAEQRQRWPVVSGQITVNQGDATLDNRTDVLGGISFELPVLNLRGGAIARARAQRAVAEAMAVGDARKLFADLVDAYRRTEGAAERSRALRTEVLPAMEQARQMTEEGYRAGRVDLLRLLEAQRAVLDSRLDQTEAAAALSRAFADLERAVGRRLDAGEPHAR